MCIEVDCWLDSEVVLGYMQMLCILRYMVEAGCES